MFEKIKRFIKAQGAKIPPLWKMYVTAGAEFYRGLETYLTLRIAAFCLAAIMAAIIIFFRASRVNKLKIVVGYILVVGVGVAVLWATGFVATAAILPAFGWGIYFSILSPVFVFYAALLLVDLEVGLSKVVGAISVFFITIGAYADNANAIVAKAELNCIRDLIKLDVSNDWIKINALYARAERLGHPDAGRLRIDRAAELFMRHICKPRLGRGFVPAPGYFSDALTKEAFEKMINCRYEKKTEHRNRRRQPVDYFKESRTGMTPLIYALQNTNGSEREAIIKNILNLARDLDISIELKKAMLTAKLNNGNSVLNELATIPAIRDNVEIQAQISEITEGFRINAIDAAENISAGAEGKIDNMNTVAEYLIEYSPNVPKDIIEIISHWDSQDIRLECELCLMSTLKEEDGPQPGRMYLEKQGKQLKYIVLNPQGETVTDFLDISIEGEPLTTDLLNGKRTDILDITSRMGHIHPALYDMMKKKEGDLVEEIRGGALRANERHQNELVQQGGRVFAQTVHAGGNDPFAREVDARLRRDLGDVGPNAIQTANTEFRAYMESLLKESGDANYTGPGSTVINEAIVVYDYATGPNVSKDASDMMALVWMALKHPEKLTGPDAQGIDTTILSENLKERMVSALSDAARAYSVNDVANLDHLACISGTKVGLSLVLNKYYEGLEYNSGFEMVGNIERMNERDMVVRLRHQIVTEARAKAMESGRSKAVFLGYVGGSLTDLGADLTLNPPRPAHPDQAFWEDIVEASFQKLWTDLRLSRSEFLIMWQSIYDELTIEPLMLLMPDLDLETQYLDYCRSLDDYDSLKKAVFAPGDVYVLKEFQDYLHNNVNLEAIPSWMKGVGGDYFDADIIEQGLLFIDAEKLQELWFDYEGRYQDFCKKILEVENPEDSLTEEQVQNFERAVTVSGDVVQEFKAYLDDLNLVDIPEWKLSEDSISQSLRDLNPDDLDKLKNLRWLKLTDLDLEKQIEYKNFLQNQYLKFCVSLSLDSSFEEFEIAVNYPKDCKRAFEGYLNKNRNIEEGQEWILSGFPVSDVLNRMNIDPRVKRLKQDLLVELAVEEGKENSGAIEILSAPRPPSSGMLFQFNGDGDARRETPLLPSDSAGGPPPSPLKSMAIGRVSVPHDFF